MRWSLTEVLKTHLSEEHLKLLGLVKDESNYIDTLDKLVRVSIESAVMRAYSIIEEELLKLLVPFLYTTRPARGPTTLGMMMRSPYLEKLLEDFRQKGYATIDMGKLQVLREARNYAAHSPENAPSKIDWQKAFNIAKELLIGLQKASDSGYTLMLESKSDDVEQQSNS